jgi:hypothetical protein
MRTPIYFTQNLSGFGLLSQTRLIGIKRKPCEVSQSLLHKPSLNSNIIRNPATQDLKLETSTEDRR